MTQPTKVSDWESPPLESLEMPPKKTLISIRLDDDVIGFFKSAGPGYQTRINAVLRSYMGHQHDR